MRIRERRHDEESARDITCRRKSGNPYAHGTTSYIDYEFNELDKRIEQLEELLREHRRVFGNYYEESF